MGMSNSAVSRLNQTWDKLPSKFRKLFSEFEALIDPSRNHRAYRYVYHCSFRRRKVLREWFHKRTCCACFAVQSHNSSLFYLSPWRMSVGKLQPPVIPFMPLLLKDMTFAHEGNKTSVDGLVNFEKMHMMASTMRAVRFCRSRHLGELVFSVLLWRAGSWS